MTHPVLFFFFNDTATTEIYTLSLHDALPIFLLDGRLALPGAGVGRTVLPGAHADQHIPHPVGIPGHVREDMTPGPPGEQRRDPQLRIGDNPRRAEPALPRLVDLVTQLT